MRVLCGTFCPNSRHLPFATASPSLFLAGKSAGVLDGSGAITLDQEMSPGMDTHMQARSSKRQRMGIPGGQCARQAKPRSLPRRDTEEWTIRLTEPLTIYVQTSMQQENKLRLTEATATLDPILGTARLPPPW